MPARFAVALARRAGRERVVGDKINTMKIRKAIIPVAGMATNNRTNITLIGMPGSGKSYIGKKLANRIGYTLIELDSLLEQEYNLPLQQILDKLGDETFLEKQANDAILYTKSRDGLIVSPGGSIVYTDYAMEHLNDVSKIIYLKTSLKTIKRRITETPRGIVGLKDNTLEYLYKERTLLYEKWALIIIDAEQDSEKVIHSILKTTDNRL